MGSLFRLKIVEQIVSLLIALRCGRKKDIRLGFSSLVLIGDGDPFSRLMGIKNIPHLLHGAKFLSIDRKDVVSRLDGSQTDRA